jgi:hypothetical protein
VIQTSAAGQDQADGAGAEQLHLAAGGVIALSGISHS